MRRSSNHNNDGFILDANFQKILDFSNEHIALTTAEGRILYSNNGIEKLLGYTAEEYVTMDLRQYVHPEDFPIAVNLFRDVHRNPRQRQSAMIRSQHKDGHYVWTEIHGTNLLDESDVNALVFQMTDISHRRELWVQQERKLRYHGFIQDNVRDAVIVTDMQLVIQSWNKAAETIYGWGEDEVIGKRSADILKSEFPEGSSREQHLSILREKGELTSEYIHYDKDGNKVYILASISVVKDSDEKPFAIISLNRNITPRKEIEIALNAKIAEEREFQSYLTRLHELNIELSKIEVMDDFCKQAVTLGRERFGFERMGLLLYDEDKHHLTGTYGTNAAGETVDERHYALSPDMLTGILGKALAHTERFIYEDNAALFDNQQLIAYGWNAVAALWNGEKVIGCLAVDSGLSEKTASKAMLDILALYSTNLGTSISQRRITRALSANRERFRLFIEDAPIAVVVSNKEGKIQLINAEAVQLLGYQADEIIGQSIEVLVPESKRAGHHKLRENHRISAHKRTMGNVRELFARRKDGGLFWADIQLSQIQTDDDLLIMAFIEDISERKLAEESLTLYAKETEDLYNKAPCGYHSLDGNGLIIAINDTELQWLGYEREEILGRRYYPELLTPASQELFKRNFAVFKQEGYINDVELELIRKDGSQFFVSLSATVIKDEEGQFLMSRSTVFDVSVRHEAKQLLEQALSKERELGELKSRFVSMASHEFRTPLAVIKSLTDMVVLYGERQGLDWSKTKLGKVSEQIEHLTTIMNDVLNLGRLQSGKTEFKPHMEDFAAFVLKMIEEFRFRPEISHHFLDEIDENLPNLMLDLALMRQLVNNLLSNAVKYSQPDKPIHVRLWRDDGEIVLEVHDKGIGIPEEDLPRLFEPFHRASNVSGIQGTGMGLSITKEIAEKHGGRLYAESKVGQGTSMFLRIPL